MPTPGQTCHAFALMTTQGSGHQWGGRIFEQPLQMFPVSSGVCSRPTSGHSHALAPTLGALPSLASATNEGTEYLNRPQQDLLSPNQLTAAEGVELAGLALFL